MKAMFTIQLIIVLVVGTGWVKSIYKLSDCDFVSPYKAEVIYGIGVFVPPVGMITGWLDLGQ